TAARIDVSGRTKVPEVAKSVKRLPGVINAQKTLIAIGGSTGGTEAIKLVLSRLPESTPGVLITQHIPPKFSKPFAVRLNACCALNVTEAEDGAPVGTGVAYVAPGDKHLEVVARSGRLFCRLSDAPAEHYQKPAVDVLFRSVVKAVGEKAVGVVLTGMGRDGGDGLKAMHEAGATTIAQDEASSVVWGMPGHAVELEAADEIVSLNSVAERIVSALTRSKKRR
ncbi:MAG: CheB methylesterase domain-containing protein, partial [Gammaproteobacteria bacterium]|nr:CheB methylesterase domain-containing protein [Gammaproteobacteria bacterium]